MHFKDVAYSNKLLYYRPLLLPKVLAADLPRRMVKLTMMTMKKMKRKMGMTTMAPTLTLDLKRITRKRG